MAVLIENIDPTQPKKVILFPKLSFYLSDEWYINEDYGVCAAHRANEPSAMRRRHRDDENAVISVLVHQWSCETDLSHHWAAVVSLWQMIELGGFILVICGVVKLEGSPQVTAQISYFDH